MKSCLKADIFVSTIIGQPALSTPAPKMAKSKNVELDPEKLSIAFQKLTKIIQLFPEKTIAPTARTPDTRYSLCVEIYSRGSGGYHLPRAPIASSIGDDDSRSHRVV